MIINQQYLSFDIYKMSSIYSPVWKRWESGRVTAKKRKQTQDSTYPEELDKKAQIQSFRRLVPFTGQFAK